MNGPAAPLGAGRLVVASLGLFARAFGFLFPLAFVPALGLTIATYALIGSPDPAAGAAPVGVTTAFVVLALNVVVGFIVTGVMCLAGLDVALGKRHSLGEYLSHTLRHAGPVVVLGTLLSLATALGVVFLLLPGLYIAARWLPWAPAILFENLGWAGMARAQELTEGRRGGLVVAILMLGGVMVALVLAMSPLLLAIGATPMVAALLDAVLTAIYYGIVACFTAVAYLRLRELGEGIDAASVAATIE